MIKFFIPSKYYLPLSLSGSYCELNCPFCRREFIKSMLNTSSPKVLKEVLERKYKEGSRGFLLSGGFNKYGYLIINKEHLRVVREFKKNHPDTVISIHLGLAPTYLIDLVWESEIDFIDYEVPPSDKYITSYKGIKGRNINDYLKILEYSINVGGKKFIAPHLILCSKYSTINDELSRVYEISMLSNGLLVVLVEIKLGSGSNVGFKDLPRTIRVLSEARRRFNLVSLGCMRPSVFRRKFDEEIIKLRLVDRVAVPSNRLINRMNCVVINACCSVSEEKLSLFPSKTIIVH